MNNFIISVCIAMSVFCVDTQSVQNYVNSHPLVEQCQVVEADGVVLVACITKPIFSRNEIIALEKELKDNINIRFSAKETLVCFDVSTFYEASKLNKNDASKQEKEQLIDVVRRRR